MAGCKGQRALLLLLHSFKVDMIQSLKKQPFGSENEQKWPSKANGLAKKLKKHQHIKCVQYIGKVGGIISENDCSKIVVKKPGKAL